MADQMESRLKQVEFLLDLVISKLPFSDGPRNLVDLILRYRLTFEAGEKLMDDIALMEKQVKDGAAPSQDKIRDTILASYATSLGIGGLYGGAGPYAYVTQVLRVQSPDVLLPIWRGPTPAPSEPPPAPKLPGPRQVEAVSVLKAEPDVAPDPAACIGSGGSSLNVAPSGRWAGSLGGETEATVAPVHQQNVARYLAAVSQHAHHGGHDMHIFHRDWHQQNRDPRPPASPDRNWGMNLVFGTNFLQMHHEMVKATAAEPHQHMMHESLIAWYQQQGIGLPAAWNPTTPIPAELGYTPDPNVYPAEIRQAVQQWAEQAGVTVEQFLTRTTDTPSFELPLYFTRQGVGPNEAGEPITGARKLADFQNANQLGCCIVFPHNQWHVRIGGAMGTTWTAIADPIFYFGVHWYIDRVFDDYKSIQSERSILGFDRGRLSELHALESERIEAPREFTREQKAWADAQAEISKKLHRW